MSQVGRIHKRSEGGILGTHPGNHDRPVFITSSGGNEDFSTIRIAIVPYACWKIEDVRYEFESSFLKPDVADELQDLADLVNKHTKGNQRPPLSIFGHADPAGEDEFNKRLSGRRAMALYGMLTRNVDMWEELYTQPHGGDSWRAKKVESIMLATVGYGDTSEEVKRFQRDQGLADDGIIGPLTRRALYKAYMDAICPITLDPQQDFLGRGQDPQGKADYQGCSEFNPAMLFSEKEHKEYSKPENKSRRDRENAPNRRVMVFLFRPGSMVNPLKWPCPRAKEGMADCKKRFWSDGEKRRSERLPDRRREYQETKDTFACRFYDRMASRSPCEDPTIVDSDNYLIRLLDEDRNPMMNVPYRITLIKVYRGTSPDGWVEVQRPKLICPERCLVEWGTPDAAGIYPHRSALVLECGEDSVDKKQEAIGKLNNLGYPTDLGFDTRIRCFQYDEDLEERGLDPDGNPPDNTMTRLREVYEEAVSGDEL